MINIKRKVYNVIRDDDKNDIVSNIFDGIIIVLIIINVGTIIADTFSLPEKVREIFRFVETVSVLVFTVEYILRLWTSNLKYPNCYSFMARIKYVFSFMAIIDLLAILPFYIPFIIPIDLRVLRSLRVIRLFSVFKVHRYTTAFASFARIFKNKKSQLVSSVFILFLLMIIASIIMYSVENEAQPEAFNNAFSALWWAVATLTTVGYGDIYPVTVLGKILTSVIAILGIGLVAVPTGIISVGFLEIHEDGSHKDKKSFCPYCGHTLDE